MKKSTLFVAAAFLVLFAAMPRQAAAQKYQGQVNITTGGSFSVIGLLINPVLRAVDENADANIKTTPGLNGMVDYGLTDRFSLGASYYYQSFTANFNGYTDTAGNVYTGDYFLRITRQNIGMRALFHFGDNDDLDIYAGARAGYTIWSYKTDITNTSLSKNSFTGALLPQAIFGMRYYFTPNIGVNTEFAIGPPYYLMLGVNARFGGA